MGDRATAFIAILSRWNRLKIKGAHHEARHSCSKPIIAAESVYVVGDSIRPGDFEHPIGPFIFDIELNNVGAIIKTEAEFHP